MNSSPRVAVIMSEFNDEVTSGLLNGVMEVFEERRVKWDKDHLYSAPGAFELPLLAQTIAHTGKYDGVICLGCVIKGDTAHFEFISLGATVGIMQAQLNTGVPISFGVLTTYNDEQAAVRSQKGSGNKGREAALACLKSIDLLSHFR